MLLQMIFSIICLIIHKKIFIIINTLTNLIVTSSQDNLFKMLSQNIDFQFCHIDFFKLLINLETMQQSKSLFKKQNNQNWESELKRPLKNKQQFSQQCMKVYCRIKPLTQQQQLYGMILDQGQNSIVLSNQEANRSVSKKFIFTEIFKNQTQRQIVQKLCDPILESLKTQEKGALIFAYGVTNSGKTYTILGTKQQPGILNYLLQKLPNGIKLTPVQIYNQQFFPLTVPRFKLHPKQTSGFFQFKDYDPIIITEENRKTVLHQCYQNRMQNDTVFNQKSSRSHAIFKIQIQNKIIGVVDLAGSQRSKQGCNMVQTAAINKSLLCLGRCIQALKQQKYNNQIQIPYRQSKLTKALMEYFNPNYNLVMIVNINPIKLMLNQTLKVLQYAALARDIKHNTPVISRYKNIANSKSKIFVTLEQTKSQFDCYNQNKSKLKVKKCNSVYEFDDMSQEQQLKKYKQFEQYKEKQAYLNEYYHKLKANNDMFNYYYNENFKKQQQQTEQQLKKLQSYKKCVKTEKNKPSFIPPYKIETMQTSINTSPSYKNQLEQQLKRKIQINLQAMYSFKFRLRQQELNERLKHAENCQKQFKDMIQKMKEEKQKHFRQQNTREQEYNQKIQFLEKKLRQKSQSVSILKESIEIHSNKKPNINKLVQAFTSPIKFFDNSKSKLKNALGGFWRSISPNKEKNQEKKLNEIEIKDQSHRISFGQQKKQMVIQSHKNINTFQVKCENQNKIQQAKQQNKFIVSQQMVQNQKFFKDQEIQTKMSQVKQNLHPNQSKLKKGIFQIQNFNIFNSQDIQQKNINPPPNIIKKPEQERKNARERKYKKSNQSKNELIQNPRISPIANRLRNKNKKQN